MKDANFDQHRRLLMARTLALGAVGAAWTATRALAQSGNAAALLPTPAQAEGPFYPLREPSDADFDLLRNGSREYAKGNAAWVEGVVLDLAGKPVRGGAMKIWQCDADGHYDHPRDGSRMDQAFQGFGRVTLDGEGRFRFRTIRPSPYVGRTPHIHAKVKLGRQTLLTTQLYVEGDPGNARDGIWRRLSEAERASVTVPYVNAADGLKATYRIVVRA
jgi:protocatechuate 3,4-dioxygenase, beta subunit